MILAKGRTAKSNKQVIFIGIGEDEIRELLNGDPIKIGENEELEKLGVTNPQRIMIFFGGSDDETKEILRAAGVLTPESKYVDLDESKKEGEK